MKELILNRRDLTRLALAAFGGLASGALIGCGGPAASTGKPVAEKPAGDKEKPVAAAETPRLLQDPHVCRGINTCKGKGQGGCGENPGENECKGKGDYAVPLDAGKKMTWQKARKRFEELMKKAGKTFGAAPAA